MGGPKLVQPFYPETSSYPARPVSHRLRRNAQQLLSETALCESRLDNDGAGEKLYTTIPLPSCSALSELGSLSGIRHA